MTAKELDTKIRELIPGWLLEEVDAYIERAEMEEWEYQPKTCVECFDDWGSADWTDSRKYQLAMTKIERALGVQRQLGPDEQATSMSSSGTRNLYEGDWIFDKRWDELITD